jgi:hypothetical protein
MKNFIRASLIVNIVVLVPIVFGMFADLSFIDRVWGVSTESRGILASIYFALLVLSLILIVRPIVVFVVPLLTIQVIYKLTTPFVVGLFHPVVLSNIAIAVLHGITLWVIYTHRHELDVREV